MQCCSAVGIALAVFSHLAMAEAPGKLAPGEQVRLSRDEPLFLLKNLLGTGRAGTVYIVAKADAEAHRIYVWSKDAHGATIALNLADDAAEPAFPPKYAPEVAEFLRVITPSYFLNGRQVPAPADSPEVVKAQLESTDADVKAIAELSVANVDLHKAARELPEKQMDAIRKMDGQLRGLVLETFGRGLVGQPKSDEAYQEDVEKISRIMVDAKTQEFSIHILGAKFSNAMLGHLTGMAQRKHLPPADGKLPIFVTTGVSDDFLWVEVRNLSPFTLNQSIIRTRRVPDSALLTPKYKERAMAGFLGLLVASPELVGANDRWAALELQYLEMERGTHVYVPAIPPGATVRMGVTTAYGVEYTKTVAASLWCNEGAAPEQPAANIQAFLKKYTESATPGPAVAQSRPGVPAAPGRGTIPPSRGGLQPSSGLQMSKGKR